MRCKDLPIEVLEVGDKQSRQCRNIPYCRILLQKEIFFSQQPYSLATSTLPFSFYPPALSESSREVNEQWFDEHMEDIIILKKLLGIKL